MDRRFGRWGIWFALGVLALVFLCILTCIGSAALLAPRPAVTWMQPPTGEGAVIPPTVSHPAHGVGGFLGAGIGLLFKLLLFGLLVLVLLKLVGRLFWGCRHAVAPYGYGPWPGAPGDAAEGSGPGVAWGPPAWKRHAWRHHPHPWGPPPWWGSQPPAGPAADGGPEGQAGEDEPETPAGEYTGPME